MRAYCDFCKKPVSTCACWFIRRLAAPLAIMLMVVACGMEVSSDDVEATAEALTYTHVNSNNGASLSTGSSNKASCLRGYMEANGPSGSNTYTCASDQCNPTVPNAQPSVHAGSCGDMTIGVWNKVCPLYANTTTSGTGGNYIGVFAYNQSVENCGYYPFADPVNLRIAGAATFGDSKSYWPAPSNLVPGSGTGTQSCHMQSHPCDAGGGIGVGGGICVTKVCP